ncbi:MAG: 50S ribosomal protein L24 [Bacteroidia bacterium]
MAKQNKLHIKKGDTVRIISGSGKGTEGRVMKVFPQKMTAIVEGKKIVKKHMRPSQQYPDGGIIEQEAPIHVSNLMLIDPVPKNLPVSGKKG